MENIVYTTDYCPYCAMVKDLLKKLGVEFEERVLDTPEEKDEVKKKYKWGTVPMVILNGQFIGGYDHTKKLADSGKLDEILNRRP